ncbi:MAG: tetratricopeptide repeat protein [Dysgonomonas sp.]
MKYKLSFILCAFILSSCSSTQNNANTRDCVEGINLLPLYGNIEKCEEQKLADKKFLIACDSIYPSRKNAAEDYVRIAWDYADRDDVDNATKRFNQAYLLDSLNADVYWGLGIIEGSKKRYIEAEVLFRKSLDLNPKNEKVWFCLVVNDKEQYGDDENHKIERDKLLKKILEMNSNFYPAIQMIQRESHDLMNKHDDGTRVIITQPQ